MEYYEERIKDATETEFYPQALEALNELKKSEPEMRHLVVHGDLHGLNMVIDPENMQLEGVIDLSEMEIGDPHQDFRKIFMTDPRMLQPAIEGYELAGGRKLNAEVVKTWAYVNEWANLCHFADDPEYGTYQRALHHLRLWDQL